MSVFGVDYLHGVVTFVEAWPRDRKFDFDFISFTIYVTFSTDEVLARIYQC